MVEIDEHGWAALASLDLVMKEGTSSRLGYCRAAADQSVGTEGELPCSAGVGR